MAGNKAVLDARRTGDNEEAKEGVMSESPSEAATQGTRWGRAGEESPGGTAMTESGQINLERFSIGPETDLSVSWWNKRLVWQVRREPTGHEVVVVRMLENVWKIHILIAAIAIAVGMVLLIAVAGLNPGWVVLFGLGLGGAAYALLLLEQKIGDHRVGIQDAFVLDSRLWRAVVARSEKMILTQTKAGQKSLYADAVKYYRERYEAKYGDPDTGKVGKKWANPETGRIEDVPKFEVPQAITEAFLNEEDRLTPDAVAERIGELLSPSGRARATASLMRRYETHPQQAEAMGRGVLGCGCVACAYNAQHKIRPALFGAEARRRAELAEAKRAADRGEDPTLLSNPLRRMVLTRAGEISSGKVAAPERASERVSPPRAAAAAPPAPLAVEPQTSEDASVDVASEPAPGRRKWLVAAGVVAVLAVAGVAGLMMVSSGGSTETEPPAITAPVSEPAPSTPSSSATPTPTSTAPPVPKGEKKGQPMTFGPGDAGGRDGGAELIAAYEYHYYVSRDPEAAMKLYAPEARGDVSALRNGIEANPTGTGYTLTVTPVVPGEEYDVDLRIEWPGLEPGEATQKFFTTYIDGEFYILRAESR